MYYQIHELTKYSELFHAFSTVTDGNMSFRWGEVNEVQQNRQKFLAQLNINHRRVVSADLEHGDKIIAVTASNGNVLNNDDKLKADGLITNQPNTFLWHIVADCVSVIYYDQSRQAISLSHVSWKNAGSEIAGKTINKMTELYGTKPADLIIGLGPAIGPCCYTFAKPEQSKDPAWQNFLITKNNLTYINLAGFVKQQLVAAGARYDNILVSPECTAHSDKFFSHYRTVRSEGNFKEARFAALIGLRH